MTHTTTHLHIRQFTCGVTSTWSRHSPYMTHTTVDMEQVFSIYDTHNHTPYTYVNSLAVSRRQGEAVSYSPQMATY